MIKRNANFILILLVVGIFGWALLELFSLRFERGDTYAPYSSYRANPTGCKVLYQSLNSMGAIQSERLLRPLTELNDVTDSVMLITNVSKIDNLAKLPGLASYLRRGGNLLIFCAPLKMPRVEFAQTDNSNFMGYKIYLKSKKNVPKKPKHENSHTDQKREKHRGLDKQKSDPATYVAEDMLSPGRGLNKLLGGISLKQRKRPYRMPIAGQMTATAIASLPAIDIYSYGYLKVNMTAWQELCRARGKSMMVKAKYGRGTVMVSATSYLISNEGMLKTPPVELVAWLIGNRRRVIFNELVHGQSKVHNIAWLVGKYRLPLLLGNLLLIVALYVWRSFCSSANIQQEKHKSDDDKISSTCGLEKLLRKNISRHRLLAVCLAEWHKQPAIPSGKYTDDELLPATARNERQLQVDYNEIVKLINKQ